jgi:signal transduction histidine kinase
MQGRPWVERRELPEGATVLIVAGLSAEERSLFAAFAEELEAATGVHCLFAGTVETALGRLSALRPHGSPCAALLSAGVGEREVLRLLRWFATPGAIAPVVVLGTRSDEALLAAAMQARACDVLLRHELDADRLARTIRLAAELARRDLAEETLRTARRSVEELFELVWDLVDEGLLLVGEDRLVKRHNGAAERLLTTPGRDIAGAAFGSLGWGTPAFEPSASDAFSGEMVTELDRPEGKRIRVGLKSRPLSRAAGAGGRARIVSIRPRPEAVDGVALTAEARHFAGLGRLLAGAAHDCSNLLTPLLGYCELLSAKLSEGSQTAGYAREIERSARLAAELMNRLSDTARNQPSSEGQVLADRCLLDLAGLLHSLVGRGVEVSEELRGGDLRVTLRAGEMEQIVLNLAANARDAMPLGGRLFLRSRAEGQRLWILEVEDSGGGIAPENLGRVFDPAFTTKAAGKGTGLGLWIVRSIVEQAGGTVAVRSSLGKGTTVRVELPARRLPPETSAAGGLP